MTRKTRADRDRAHREEVAEEKRFLREVMDMGEHIYLDEWWRMHERRGNYAAADALVELTHEIREHNRDLRGGTRARIGDALDEVRATERERKERIGDERAARLVEDYRRNHPVPGSFEDEPEFNPGLQAPTGPRRAKQIRRQQGKGRPPWV